MQIGLLKTGRRFSLALLCLHWPVRFAQEDGRLLHLIKRKEEIVRVKTGEGGLWTLLRQVKLGGQKLLLDRKRSREIVEPFCVCQRLLPSVVPGSGVETAGEVEERGWWPAEGAFCTGRVYRRCYIVYVMKDSFW